jgi:hypothetical protein
VANKKILLDKAVLKGNEKGSMTKDELKRPKNENVVKQHFYEKISL